MRRKKLPSHIRFLFSVLFWSHFSKLAKNTVEVRLVEKAIAGGNIGRKVLREMQIV